MENKIWKKVKGFKGYEISEYGDVKSLSRIKKIGYKTEYLSKEIILKQHKNTKGYFCVTLSKNGKVKKFQVHQLVAICFLNHTPNNYNNVVDHDDNDKENNHYKNLKIITQRENSTKDINRGSSSFVGVYWYGSHKKWCSKIMINKKRIYLGLFETEEEAGFYYKIALMKIDLFDTVLNYRKFIKNEIKKGNLY